MADFDGFPPIIAIFYAVFHPTEGSKVLCQVPEGSIVPPSDNNDSSALGSPLFQFDRVKNYVIPKPALCNRLVTLKIGNYRIVGHPVHIYDPDYERNSFVFNFAFVFSYQADSSAFDTSIRRLARLFMALEEQNKFLSSGSSITGSETLKTIGSIIEQIHQDINNYSECMIPIDESNSVNMKLFPLLPPPPDIKPYHVPISTVRLEMLVDDYWDPTMEKILKYINGINSVNRIADLANADYELTRQCIRHLMYYRCIIIADLFQFSNIYAPTSDIASFIEIPELYRECQAYVYHPANAGTRHRVPSHTSSQTSGVQMSTSANSSILSTSSSSFSNNYYTMQNGFPSHVTLFFLYRSLHQGQTVKEWCLEYKKLLANIDVRRFLSFGVIKGLIYRVQSYPILESKQIKDPDATSIAKYKSTPPISVSKSSPQFFHPRNQSIDSSARGSDVSIISRRSDKAQHQIDHVIERIVKRPKHFDSICTDLQMSRAEVEQILQSIGDWTIVSC